jgi:dTDP-4-dehydrorhamnose reductase
MLHLGRTRSSVRVVHDQVGAPTYAPDLARLIAEMIVTDRYGVYHAANEGECSFAELAAAVMREARLPCQVLPIPSSEYPTAARRPLNSRLSLRALDENGFARLPAWEDALGRYLQEFPDIS